MAIPVYINQNPTGELTLSQSGLYTVIEASADAQGLVRLWAHGSGKSAYLGVMEPKDGGLYLCHRLSRRELAAFPDPIEFASDRETENLHNEVNIIKEALADEENKTEDSSAENKPEPETNMKSLPNNQTDYRACPWPAEPPEDGLLWYSRPDGSLVAFDGISSLIALPAEPGARLPRAAERVIEGQKYLVFRY